MTASSPSAEIDGGTLNLLFGQPTSSTSSSARSARAAAGAVRAPAGDARQGDQVIERFKARASHAAQVQSRVKKLEKIDSVEPHKRRQTVAFEFQPAPRSGEDVVSLKKRAQGIWQSTIYEGLDFSVRRKERWCVMGVNGAGKSTAAAAGRGHRDAG